MRSRVHWRVEWFVGQSLPPGVTFRDYCYSREFGTERREIILTSCHNDLTGTKTRLKIAVTFQSRKQVRCHTDARGDKVRVEIPPG